MKHEKISVSSPEVSCNGGSTATGHPKVYLHINSETGTITCPYCGRIYILKAGSKKTGAH